MSIEKGFHDGHRKRMQQKLLDNPDGLLEHELLEIMLFGALPRKNTNEIAHKLIKKFGSISNVLEADSVALQAVDGVGKSVSAQIILTGRLLKEISKHSNENVYIKNLYDVKNLCEVKFKNKSEETFLLIMLNKNNKLLGITEFYDNDFNNVSASASEVANSLSVFRPTYVVLVHNHPSGIAKPSKYDDVATLKINALCEVHGISLIEHAIYTPHEVYSYKNDGKLDELKKSADFNGFFNKL